MRRKSFILALATVTAVTMFAGCSKKEEEPVETEPIVTEATTVAETEPVIVFEGDEGDITADEAVDLCLKGYNAMANNNIKEILKNTNINLYYYIAEGEWANNDKLIELWNSSKGEDALTYGGYTSLNNVQYMKAYQLEPEVVKEYNDFASRIIEDYIITDGYRIDVTLEDTTYDEAGMATITTRHTEFLVLKGNGMWRLDVCVSSMKKLFGVFSGKSTEPEIVTEIIPAETEVPVPSETTAPAETAVPVYVTDENGYIVTDENGLVMTEPPAETSASIESVEPAPEDSETGLISETTENPADSELQTASDMPATEATTPAPPVTTALETVPSPAQS